MVGNLQSQQFPRIQLPKWKKGEIAGDTSTVVGVQISPVHFNPRVERALIQRTPKNRCLSFSLLTYVHLCHISADRIEIIMYFIQCSLGLSHIRDKNEAISLWLLELDRQKNRARVLEETARKSTVQSPSNQHDPWFNFDKSHKDENKRLSIYEATGLEHLMKEKGSLEEESHCLDEAQKRLDQRTKMLTDKIIQEIKKRNSEKKHAIDQLRVRMHSLEAQLDSLSVPYTPQKIKVRKPESAKTNQYQT